MSNCLVPLPSSVEDMLIRICVEQSHPPLDTIARQKLASLGEEASLKLLREIRQERNIEDLNKFVTFIAAKLSSNPLEHSGSPPHTSSPQLVALGELEFRKAFLVLSYTGRKKVEDVISPEEIRKLKELEMGKFKSELWKVVGPRCTTKDSDRRERLDWHSRKPNFGHYQAYANGSCSFKKKCKIDSKKKEKQIIGGYIAKTKSVGRRDYEKGLSSANGSVKSLFQRFFDNHNKKDDTLVDAEKIIQLRELESHANAESLEIGSNHHDTSVLT